MTVNTLTMEAQELARRLPAKDPRFARFADLLGRVAKEQPKYLEAIDKWYDASGAVEVLALQLPVQAQRDQALQPLAERAAAIGDAAGLVGDCADAVRKAAPGPRAKPFTDDFQRLALDLEKVGGNWGSEGKSRLASYATAENAARKAVAAWRMRLDQLSKEARSAMAEMTDKDTDTVQRRKFIQARIVGVAADLNKALANTGL